MSVSDLLKSAQKIADASLKAVNSKDCIQKAFKKYPDLLTAENITVLAIGKAGPAMADAALEILGDRVMHGVVITKHGHTKDMKTKNPNIQVFEAGHPIPDETSLHATIHAMEILAKSKGSDLILVLLSGGGSALFTLPEKPLTLDDIKHTTDLLLKSGASIHELNAVRKHLDSVKGGKLLQYIGPKTRVAAFVLSNVVGDDLHAIASGPTEGDPSTFADVMEILKRYNVENDVPERVKEFLHLGMEGKVNETTKPDNPIFKHVTNSIIGNAEMAVKAAEQSAKKLGFNTLVLTTSLHGEARDAGVFVSSIAKDIVTNMHPVKKPACVIMGGETTVTLKGKGSPCRNQETALSAAIGIEGMKDVLVYAFDSDGADSIPGVAGAYVTGKTVSSALEKKLIPQKFLDDNNSNEFFKQAGGLIITGQTGTAVNDLIFLLIK